MAGSLRPRSSMTRSRGRRSAGLQACLPALLIAGLAGCTKPAPDPAGTTKATYDKKTGRLTQLTYDRNHNGTIDTWTDMDGAKPLRSRIDLNEDGRIDRWEYYDEKGALAKVGFSRTDNGKPDAWAYQGPDGKVARVEVSSTGDEHKIDRWEFYEAGVMTRAEEDTNGDGRPDKWESYENGSLAAAAFDETGDGKPDRRLTYRRGELVMIESAPDSVGHYTKTVNVR